MGFEQGYIKIFDFSHHFADSRLDEMKQSLFLGQAKRTQFFHQNDALLPVQVIQKKCGALGHTNSFKLNETEVIQSIFCVEKSGNSKYLLIATISCQIYVLNYHSCQPIHKFDMQAYRISQTLSLPDHFVPQNTVNMCYFMQPYFGFDIQKNALVLFLDRYGISLINLKSQEVYQIISYEDQAHYYRK